MRRLLMLVLFALVLAGGAVVTWKAMGQAKLVEDDLATARALLARAGGLEAGKLEERLRLVDRAEAHTTSAQRRLGRWPLRQLGALPLVGRDVRVAAAVATSATRTVRATRQVVTALQLVQTHPPTRASIRRAAEALLALHGTLSDDLERVRAARPLLTAAGRDRYLEAATSASTTAERAGRSLKLAAGLYGPAGTARWFLAFQNPAELRGTGGLIGEYGILESSPTGPKLTTVDSYQALDRRTTQGVQLPRQVASRYGRFAIDRAWSSVNIPPDMPTVGRIITGLYQQVTGDRIDGVIAADPLAVAKVLDAGGPIQAGGKRLTSANVAQETLVQAYVRYAKDNPARKRYLEQVARASFASFQRAVVSRPAELVKGLAAAARGRHLQVYSADPAGQAALVGLGLAGGAAAPAEGDYLMPVGINAGGNKLDAFMERTLDWRVRLAADGSARATATLTLHNTVPSSGLPRYIVGPYDSRFRKGVNEQIQSLYVAGGYGFSRASLDGRPVGAEAEAELGGLALTQAVGVPAGATATLRYELARAAAAEVVGGDRLRYRLLLRPQATVRADQARVAVVAPSGWRFAALPPGARVKAGAAAWAGSLDRERELVFELAKA
jgi:Protein of unknown function (DUF4012)